MKFKTSALILRQLRRKNKLTQHDLAKCIKHNTSQYISNCERGLCALSANHFKVIAKLLKINPSIFMDAYLVDERYRIERLIK